MTFLDNINRFGGTARKEKKRKTQQKTKVNETKPQTFFISTAVEFHCHFLPFSAHGPAVINGAGESIN